MTTAPSIADVPARSELAPYSLPVHASTVSCWQKCPRKLFARYRMGLSPARSRPALFLGTAAHDYIHKLLTLPADQDALTFIPALKDKRIADATAKLRGMGDTSGMLPWGQPVQNAIDLAVRAERQACALAQWAWGAQIQELTQKYEVIATEQELRVLIESIGDDRFRGMEVQSRLDLVIRGRKSGQLFILDFKTCSSDLRDSVRTCGFEPQTWLYPLVWEAYSKEHVHGVMHLVLQTPSIRQKKTETFEEYLDRLRTTYDERLSAFREATASRVEPEKGPPILLSTCHRHSGALTEWAELLRTVRHRSRCSVTSFEELEILYPRNATACMENRRACEFLPACSQATTPLQLGALKELLDRGIFKQTDPGTRLDDTDEEGETSGDD